MTHQCPNCGRYTEDEADGYYAKLAPYHDMEPIEAFCNEACCDKYTIKNPPNER